MKAVRPPRPTAVELQCLERLRDIIQARMRMWDQQRQQAPSELRELICDCRRNEAHAILIELKNVAPWRLT